MLHFSICALGGFVDNKFLTPLSGIGSININSIFVFLRLVSFSCKLICFIFEFSGDFRKFMHTQSKGPIFEKINPEIERSCKKNHKEKHERDNSVILRG